MAKMLCMKLLLLVREWVNQVQNFLYCYGFNSREKVGAPARNQRPVLEETGLDLNLTGNFYLS